MVKLAMSFIDKIEDDNIKMDFIKAMKTVCEKKIYLEVIRVLRHLLVWLIKFLSPRSFF